MSESDEPRMATRLLDRAHGPNDNLRPLRITRETNKLVM
jgi:hypothetical protein